MKKIIFVLILFLSVSGLFAKDKSIYKKKTSVSVIELFESKENPKYYISIYEKDLGEGYNNCIINCDDKDKITEFLKYIIEHSLNNEYFYYAVLGYEIRNTDLQLIDKKTELVKGNIEERTMYILE